MASSHGSPNSRPTRTDVAKLAGVSTAVVSYVLNNGPRAVSREARDRVEKAARMLNYRPNPTAQALRTGSPKIFGVVATDFANPFFSAINNTLERQAADNGYSTLFLTSHNKADRERDCIDRLLSRNVDAIFGEFSRPQSQVTDALNTHRPFILMDHIHTEPGFKYVCSDFAQASHMVACHLFEHGHRDIAMIFGEEPDEDSPRFEGWYRAHREHGLRVGPIVRSGYTRAGGYKAALRLLDSPTPPTAIFAGSDFEAIGALRAVHEHGLRVPEDIAIVSMDGTEDCEYTCPQLTSVKQDTDELPRRAIAAALTPQDIPDLQFVPVTLDLRRSCGCA